MDNENKNPDVLNKDEELTAVLKRLSELLDSSVSLEEAIALAKKSNEAKNEEASVATEEAVEAVEETVEETVEEPEEIVEETAEEAVEETVDNADESAEAEEITVEADAETEEALGAVPSEESVVSEADNAEEAVEEGPQSTLDMIISRISKAEKESAEKRSTLSEVAEVVGEVKVEEPKQAEETDVAEVKKSPFGILELIATLKDGGDVDSDTEEEQSLDDAAEQGAETEEESAVALEEAETVNEEHAVTDSGETVTASSKIFGELLACFEGKKIPEELLASDSVIVERAEEVVEASEVNENEETCMDEEITEITDGETEEDNGEFVPLRHDAPDEKDELFTEIFSEERSERKNKEKDRKKWQKSGGESSSFVLGIFDWLEVIVLSAAFALILFTFVMRVAVVDGDSMNHTLHNQEVLIISDLAYVPENGDIIVFSSPNYPEPIVKRVIAVPGQTVDIDFETWTVTVDGKVVEEDYVNRVPGSMNRSDMEFPLTVPEGKVFVMGDNRNESLDSRNSRIGLVDERYILGEVKIRLFPLDRFGKVD